jgi:hypothetical protein
MIPNNPKLPSPLHLPGAEGFFSIYEAFAVPSSLLLGPLATFVREPMKAPTVNFVNSKNAGETSVVPNLCTASELSRRG